MGLGAPLGGLINDAIGWRWAFYNQVPVLAASSVLVYLNVRYDLPTPPSSGTSTPVPGRSKVSTMALLKRIDFAGSFLLAGWVGSALLAISLKTNSTDVDAYRWTDPTILGLFAASAVLFAIFLLVELKLAAEPVMPFELLNRRTPVSVALNNFLISIVTFGTVSFTHLHH
jgi:MFS family permease